MVTTKFFDDGHLKTLDEAVAVSEEVTSDHFSLSSGHWIRNPYEICTLKDAGTVDIPEGVLAHLMRFGRPFIKKKFGKDIPYFYRIYLHDQRILDHTNGGRRKRLYPLLIYIVTHELVHIARFSLFNCFFRSGRKGEEERIVHRQTRLILSDLKIPGLPSVLERFAHCA